MTPDRWRVLVEVVTLSFFVVTVAHALILRGRVGAWFFGALLGLGFVRENFVVLQHMLYGYGSTLLRLGAAPLVATVIWAYSLYVAACWAESSTGERLDAPRLSGRFYGLVALFMMALAAFYEPFLALLGMARWEEGTRTTLGVPWIALVGYPTLTVPFLALWRVAMRRRGPTRATGMAVRVAALGLVHAWALAQLKATLGW